MAPSVLLLVGLLTSVSSLPPPRTSFLLDSADRPLLLFSLPDVNNTSTLLLSDNGSTLYVGAQDAVLSLDVSQSDVIRLRKKLEWRPSDSEINDCQSKGKNATVDCPNFVRVLQQINSTHLYVCGSFAYNPHDAFIDTESFSMVRHDDAKAKWPRCPFSPTQRNTAVTVDGELFTASTTDYRGAKPKISRHFSKDGRQDISQDSSVSLLDEPTFISSWSSDRKLYFFFSEVGKEFNFLHEFRIARVAQVCKDDVGGQRTLQNKWTSFAKAPLLCHVHKQLPFNVLQDVFTLTPPEDATGAVHTLFYGVFTSQWSSGPESAVCVFTLQDVQTAFSGSYRTFDMETHTWSSSLGQHSYLGQCGLDSAPDSDLAQVKKSFLTSSNVEPMGGGPTIVSSDQRYSHVTAMWTLAANGKHYTLLFLLTESGFLHKVVLLDRGVQVIEEIQVFTKPQLVRSVVLSSSKGVLYVGTSGGVVGVPVCRCSVYRSCSQCVLARDPLCGWSRTSNLCTTVTRRHHNMAQDVEDGNVEEECRGETRDSPVIEVSVLLNEVVRLPCLKPSNLVSLTWTSPRFANLPEKRFIHSADGGLNFLATADTFGTYSCQAEEAGYREVVASYAVKLRHVAPPRSYQPVQDQEHVADNTDELDEDAVMEEPTTSATWTSGRPEEYDEDDRLTTALKDEIAKEDGGVFFTPTPRRDARSWEEQHDDDPAVKVNSYYSEMVVVSLLLASCVCILVLVGLYAWHQKTTVLRTSPLVSPEDGYKTDRSSERVLSLSVAATEPTVDDI